MQPSDKKLSDSEFAKKYISELNFDKRLKKKKAKKLNPNLCLNLEAAEKEFGKYPEEVEDAISLAIAMFGGFVNCENELIIYPETNLYFKLGDVTDGKKLYEKVISYVSRSCVKAKFGGKYQSIRYHDLVCDFANQIVGHNFSKVEWSLIYMFYGNGCNEKECSKFIDALFDLRIPKSHLPEDEQFLDKWMLDVRFQESWD